LRTCSHDRALSTLATWEEGQPILDAYREFNSLIALPNYTPAIKTQMNLLLVQLEVYRQTNGIVRRNRIPNPRWAWLRANRGSFDVEHTDTGIEILADKRGDGSAGLSLPPNPSTRPAPE
jgi:hypothetical protein